MIVNTIIFTVTMIIIAFQLVVFADIPEYNGVPFLIIYLTLAVSELIVMTIGIPIVTAMNKRLNFKSLI